MVCRLAGGGKDRACPARSVIPQPQLARPRSRLPHRWRARDDGGHGARRGGGGAPDLPVRPGLRGPALPARTNSPPCRGGA
ncbi:MAG: hypothetical protein B7Z47_07160, partial [Chthoniobacter sp. 12-60-6]